MMTTSPDRHPGPVQEQGRPRHHAMIIGSGPAGNTAAIYLARANLEPVLFEGPRLPLDLGLGEDSRHDASSHQPTSDAPRAGGELATSSAVGNFPGFPDGISGQDIVDKFRAQALRFGTTIISERIAKVDLSSRPFRVWRDRRDPFEVALGAHPAAPPETIDESDYELADTLIYATGASAKRLHLPGEELYWQSGISTCAVCDGAAPIFRGKTLIVVGGGSSACEEALHLTRYAKKVIVLVRKTQMRASPVLFKRLAAHPAVEVRYRTEAIEAKGDEDLLQAVRVRNNETGDEEDIPAAGLFYAVGHAPATHLVRGQVDCDDDGYILTTPGSAQTSVKGFYAAGDVQDRKYRQAITSAGSGWYVSRLVRHHICRPDTYPQF